MLSFTGSLKVLLAVEPCDLRKSFNGLHGLVTERLGEDPRQGALLQCPFDCTHDGGHKAPIPRRPPISSSARA
jgi:IS66 Orf2 like protein